MKGGGGVYVAGASVPGPHCPFVHNSVQVNGFRGCRTVGDDESGQSALQLPDRSRHTTGVSDGSGRLTPMGAMSVSDRSGSPAFEAGRPSVEVSDESGRLAPRGAMSVSDSSGRLARGVASVVNVSQTAREEVGFSTEVDYPPPVISSAVVREGVQGEPALSANSAVPARWQKSSRLSHPHRQLQACPPPAPPPPVGGDDPDDSDDEGALHRSIADLRASRRVSTPVPPVDPPGAAHTPLLCDIPGAVVAFAARLASLRGGVGAIPMATLYPDLRECRSFTDVILRARQFARFDAVERAAAAAVGWAADPATPRISRSTIAADAAEVERRGIAAVLRDRIAALAPISVQPVVPVAPDVTVGVRHVPPYPSPAQVAALHDLADGAPLLLTPECSEARLSVRPPRSAESELATERLLTADVLAGLALVLPLAVGTRAYERASLPLRSSHDTVVAKALEEKGRLVVNYTGSGLNVPGKKSSLADTYGDIGLALPTAVDYCALALSSIDHFSDRVADLVVSKSDCTAWYKRIRLRPENVGQFSFVVYLDGAPHLVLPLVNQFGSQESNFQSSLVTTVIAANDRFDDVAHYGMPLSLMYSDDDAAILPSALVAERRARHKARVGEAVGAITLNPDKNVDGAVNDVIGHQLDLPRRGISLSLHRVLKFIHVVFDEIPVAACAGTRVRVHQLQRAASYMMQSSVTFPVGRPFCRALYRNTAGLPVGCQWASLTAESLVDINVWRSILLHMWVDARGMAVPLSVPPMVRRNRDETKADWASRMANIASYVVYSDAAGCGWSDPGTFGAGFSACVRRDCGLLAPILWGSWQVPYFHGYAETAGVDTTEHINFYEFLVSVVALYSLCESLPALRAAAPILSPTRDPGLPCDPPSPPTPYPTPVHIHLWTDNTSALSWMVRHKAHHPLHSFVLHMFAYLQVRYGVVVTAGHIAGLDNQTGSGTTPVAAFGDRLAPRHWRCSRQCRAPESGRAGATVCGRPGRPPPVPPGRA